jgi:hypothetical protein
MPTCVSIRAKNAPTLQCENKTAGEWCGKHKHTQVRFVPQIVHLVAAAAKPEARRTQDTAEAVHTIHRAWRHWIARRAGPLLWFREESNNPCDFFTSESVTDISMGDFISFVDTGKGYVMDARSALSIVEHAGTAAPLNPFNRNPLTPAFLRRLRRHKTKSWITHEVGAPLTVTDVFRLIEDLGYYTDPAWYIDLSRQGLQRLYVELADIWFHRAGLSVADRSRISPQTPFAVPVSTALIMRERALRPLVLKTLQSLVSAAAARSDQQLGVMYVLGALSMVSAGAGTAYPWLVDMFSPGVTRIVGGEIIVAHPSVLAY